MKQKALQSILSCGLIPIIRGAFSSEQVLEIVEVIQKSGIPVVEITLNSKGALEIVRAVRKRFDSSMLVGAGTVRTLEMFDQARDAGAQFTISPNLDPEVVREADRSDFLHLPGVLTPTEIQAAAQLGCKVVKLFPVDCFGPKYLTAVRAPLNDMMFIPTGGITADNLGDYVRAGAVAVGIGSALVSGPSQTHAQLAECSNALRRAWDEAREKEYR